MQTSFIICDAWYFYFQMQLLLWYLSYDIFISESSYLFIV